MGVRVPKRRVERRLESRFVRRRQERRKRLPGPTGTISGLDQEATERGREGSPDRHDAHRSKMRMVRSSAVVKIAVPSGLLRVACESLAEDVRPGNVGGGNTKRTHHSADRRKLASPSGLPAASDRASHSDRTVGAAKCHSAGGG